MNDYQSFIHKSRYARYIDDEKRRETWEETVQRYIDFFQDRCDLPKDVSLELFNSIVSMDVMPSMRSLMTSGKALSRDHCAGYN